MSQPIHRSMREKLAAEAKARPTAPASGLVVTWNAGGGARSARLSTLGAALLGAGALAITLWAGAVTSYVAFKDDILSSMIGRQAEMQQVYEERLREARAEISRLTSRQLVGESDLERRVDQLARRQAVLETRQSIVGSLGQHLEPARAGTIALPDPSTRARPAPVGDTLRLNPPPANRQSRLESRALETVAETPGPARSNSKAGALAQVEASLDQLETRQHAMLQAIEVRADRRARRARAVLADIGLDVERLVQTANAGPRAPSGLGGPFVPIPTPSPTASPFEHQVFRAQNALIEVERVNRALTAVPLRKPHDGSLDLSSGFGPRLDPFTRTWALHSGIDFRGATGEPVKAGASGRVVHAGSMGGYGLMVEIDHGNGIATRYAHLSRIEVSEGQTVRGGQRIGRVGSTGRSTGPHLHYETRIQGEAVDPMRFVRAGVRLDRGE